MKDVYLLKFFQFPRDGFKTKKITSLEDSLTWLVFIYLVTLLLTVFLLILFKNHQEFAKQILYGLYPCIVILISLKTLRKIGCNFKDALDDWNKNIRYDSILGLKYFAAYFLVSILLDFLGFKPPNIIPGGYSPKIINNIFNPFEIVFVIYVVCLFIPLAEEIFFKRILYVSFRHKMSFLKAFFLSCILFAALHYVNFFPIFLWSLFSYYLYERHKRLPSNIIFHSLANFWGVIHFALLI
ncbi:MAG: CPBP family intramembrane metalloprotease [Elusimicrobia bacterium]|nr:CPBP family intramembrane metalloprotease [Elusimicrobiota bacterium]